MDEQKAVTNVQAPEDTQGGGPSKKELMLLALDLRKKLDQLKAEHSEPIAIVGVGCRYPGGIETLDRLWLALQHGIDAVREIHFITMKPALYIIGHKSQFQNIMRPHQTSALFLIEALPSHYFFPNIGQILNHRSAS